MTERTEPPPTMRRMLRLLAILQCAADGGLSPLPGSAIHTIAYLTDALSPVWGLPILDALVLKQRTRPNFPALQRDLDSMVGRGMVGVERIEVSESSGDVSPVRASYRLTELSAPAISVLAASEYFRDEVRFVREVTYASSRIEPDQLADLGNVDATYSDPFKDVGSVIEIGQSTSTHRSSAEVAQRFRELAPDSNLTDAQLVHLYMRHLYSRLDVA